MELLFVVLIGIGIGLVARGVLPGRALVGVLLPPGVGGAVAAAVWVALTWLGWRWDGGLIWIVTVLVSALAVALLALGIGRRRTASDDALFGSLTRG